MSGFGKTTIFNGFLGNRPDVFCWASDYLIWSSFWSPNKILVAFGNWATVHFRHCKWCKILHSRPLLALNFIIATSFFCTIFLIFSAIVQDKRPFFTTFDYIVAVIQALQFVDYKDVLRFYFFNAI